MSLYPAFPVVRTLLPLHELVYLEGARNYTFLHFEDGSHCLYAKTLKLFEQCLCLEHFVRISKSHIVRRDYISASISAREVVLLNGLTLRVARRRAITSK